MINFSAVRPDSLAGKIVRYPFRIMPRDLVVPVLQGPLRGKKWIVGSHLHGCWLGSYELGMQKRMAKELKPGSVFYDIGANVGFYSLLAAVLVGSGRVYAFEPHPANVSYLRKHLALNAVGNVTVMESAISDSTGSASFEPEATRAAGKLAAGGSVQVQACSLDSLLTGEKLAPPHVIKMDIEGAEHRALLGAKECFAMHRPKLFLAVHGKDVHQDCCRLLTSWGYEFVYTSRESEERAELFASPRFEANESTS